MSVAAQQIFPAASHPIHQDLRASQRLSMRFDSEIAEILNDSLTSNEAFYRLYLLFRQQDKKISLMYLCRKIGVSSKGSLMLSFQSKRPLPVACEDVVPQIFHFSTAHQQKWSALIEASRYTRKRQNSCMLNLKSS